MGLLGKRRIRLGRSSAIVEADFGRTIETKIVKKLEKYTKAREKIKKIPFGQGTGRAPAAAKARKRFLGGMGVLGPDTVIYAHCSGKLERFLRSIRKLSQAYSYLHTDVYEPLLQLNAQLTFKLVPKDTGHLRGSMIASLTPAGGSRVGQGHFTRKQPLHLKLGTPGIDYAAVVNNMPTEWLVHPASYHRNISRITRRGLYDPTAREGFYDRILYYLRREARTLFEKYLKRMNFSIKDWTVRYN